MQTFKIIITEIWQAWDSLLRLPLIILVIAMVSGQMAAFISAKLKGAPDNSAWDYKTWRPYAGLAMLMAILATTFVIAYAYASTLVSAWIMLRVVWVQAGIILKILSIPAGLIVLGIGFVVAQIIVSALSLTANGGRPSSVGTGNEPYDRLLDGLSAPVVLMICGGVILVHLALLLIPFAIIYLFV